MLSGLALRAAVGLTAIAFLVVVPAAPADTAIPAADRAQISVLIDRFVKDVVKREDLAAGWLLAGHGLRVGTTRSAWIRGTGVNVPTFPARGTSFGNSWTGTLVSPGHAILSLMLFPAKGHAGVDQTAMTADVRKVGGRWLVEELYTAATFGSYGVKGPADYGPAAGKALAAGTPQRSQRLWLLAVFLAVAALVVGVPTGFFLSARRRHARALRAYHATLRSDDRQQQPARR